MNKIIFKPGFSIEKPKIMGGEPVKLAPQILRTSKLRDTPKGKNNDNK